MNGAYSVCIRTGGVHRPDGWKLDPWEWVWRPAKAPDAFENRDATGVLSHLAGDPGRRSLPVGVIGTREATPLQSETAEALGRRLGELGLAVVCGGKGGVMAAVCKGARSAGGLTVGILPDAGWRAANPYVALPVATGLGEARNAVIARAALVLVAIGNSHGTMTEIAYGLHFGRRVIGLEGAPELAGLDPAESVEAAVARLADALLAEAEAS
ncbi:MAG: hypothetical protein JKP98_09430 [Rhodobacteraceae bacterium]|jgi:uncharacterized protein (TIGR00725 family)|nr:hypothetical protein [Paracoccaceae bacterium]MBL4557255.1 hypothetical protein [Paracoccaceae bacterium]